MDGGWDTEQEGRREGEERGSGRREVQVPVHFSGRSVPRGELSPALSSLFLAFPPQVHSVFAIGLRLLLLDRSLAERSSARSASSRHGR